MDRLKRLAIKGNSMTPAERAEFNRLHAAQAVVDRCRRCGQASTTLAGHAAPSSCWGRLADGKACNGKAFDRTPVAAASARRPAHATTTASARRPAATAAPAPSRRPAALTPAQREAIVEVARANIEQARKARVRNWLLTGNY